MTVNGLHWSRGILVFALADVLMIALAWMVAFWLRFNFEMPDEYRAMALDTLPWAVGCMMIGLSLARVQRQAWRYVSLADVRQLAWGVLLGVLATVACVMVLRYPGFARSVFPIFGLLVLAMLAGARATWRSLAEKRHARSDSGQTALLIVGTLEEADQAMRTIKGTQGWHVVGIVSPQGQDVSQSLQNVKVVGTTLELGRIARDLNVRSVLLASRARSCAARCCSAGRDRNSTCCPCPPRSIGSTCRPPTSGAWSWRTCSGARPWCLMRATSRNGCPARR